MADKSNIPYDTISRGSVSSQSLFSKCCCCIPLRVGCFILGYLNLVINGIQTLSLIAITTFIGVTSHGFDHFDRWSDAESESTKPVGLFDETTPNPDETENQHLMLSQIGFILAVLLIANVAWMIINIACLVGLHKKRPGPIRVFVGFATARLLLSLAGFIYFVINSRVHSKNIVAHSFDLGLSAYFILVYYIYAVQLEKEREAEVVKPAPVNNVYVYPIKLDKSHLVA